MIDLTDKNIEYLLRLVRHDIVMQKRRYEHDAPKRIELGIEPHGKRRDAAKYKIEMAEALTKKLTGRPKLIMALETASHALRSYQHGNCSPDLAQEIADHLDQILGKAPAKPGGKHGK